LRKQILRIKYFPQKAILTRSVTLAGGTTFLQINTLALLTEKILGVASLTKCLDLGFKAEIRIKEVKINSAKPTLIE